MNIIKGHDNTTWIIEGNDVIVTGNEPVEDVIKNNEDVLNRIRDIVKEISSIRFVPVSTDEPITFKTGDTTNTLSTIKRVPNEKEIIKWKVSRLRNIRYKEGFSSQVYKTVKGQIYKDPICADNFMANRDTFYACNLKSFIETENDHRVLTISRPINMISADILFGESTLNQEND